MIPRIGDYGSGTRVSLLTVNHIPRVSVSTWVGCGRAVGVVSTRVGAVGFGIFKVVRRRDSTPVADVTPSPTPYKAYSVLIRTNFV